MLGVKDLTVEYGNIPALKQISMRVEEEELVTIIGANGAGKSTLINSIDGLKKPSSGSITFKESDITSYESWERLKLGIALVPEGGRILPDFTVKENLNLGAYHRQHQEKITTSLNEVFELFPVLKERVKQPAGTLSGGEQQMLAIGRALMADPDLLLVDEISMGLMPKLVKQVFQTLTILNGQGISVLLAEQNAKKALAIVDRGYIIENGEIILDGKSDELVDSEEVQKAYLGV